MVTNLIYYLYDIKVDVVRRNNDKYIFYYNDKYYIFKEIFDEFKVYRYFSYLKNNMFHSIVKNKDGREVSNYNNHKYILLCVNVLENRNISVSDLLNKEIMYRISFNELPWFSLWKNKIDQVEYIINSNENKFSISNLSIINYYIELSEIALAYLINNIDKGMSVTVSLCHNRIKKEFDLYDLYDISDLVLDNYTRDVGEYIKYDIINGSFDARAYFFIKYINYVDRVLLLSRVLFPSYFYDIFDDYVINDKDFTYFDKNFINIEYNERCIKELFEILTK